MTFLDRMLDLVGRGTPDPRIVVHGMPKSGTTALAMLLGAAAELRVSSDPFHQLDRRGVEFRDALYEGRLSVSALVKDHPGVFRAGLVKDPNFIFLLDQVIDVFPRAGHIVILRDPRDNIRSILNRLKLPGDPAAATPGLPGVGETWRRALEGRTPAVPGEDYVERLAHRWRLAAEALVARSADLIGVRYEAFNGAKEATIRRLLDQVGLEARTDITPLLDRQFQPKGDRSVSWDGFFGAAGLDRIERICGPMMAALDYPATGA